MLIHNLRRHGIDGIVRHYDFRHFQYDYFFAFDFHATHYLFDITFFFDLTPFAISPPLPMLYTLPQMPLKSMLIRRCRFSLSTLIFLLRLRFLICYRHAAITFTPLPLLIERLIFIMLPPYDCFLHYAAYTMIFRFRRSISPILFYATDLPPRRRHYVDDRHMMPRCLPRLLPRLSRDAAAMLALIYTPLAAMP